MTAPSPSNSPERFARAWAECGSGGRSVVVRESNPTKLEWRTAADVAQLVERNLAKVEVAGSKPVVRST